MVLLDKQVSQYGSIPRLNENGCAAVQIKAIATANTETQYHTDMSAGKALNADWENNK